MQSEVQGIIQYWIAGMIADVSQNDGVSAGKRHSSAIVPVNPGAESYDKKQRAVRSQPSKSSPQRMHLFSHALQIRADFSGRLATLPAVFFQRLGDQGIQSARHRRVYVACGGWRLVKNGLVDRSLRLARKGMPARRHLVQNQAEGEQIGAGIQLFFPNLFGGHVAGGADRDPCAGQSSSESVEKRFARPF